MKSIIIKFISAVLFIFSFWIMYIGNFTDFFIIIGTLVLVTSATLYIMSSPKIYNEAVSSTKQIANPNNMSIEELYEAFKNVDSMMGKAWLGEISTLKGKCLIFGPSEEGEFIYVYKMFNSIYATINFIPSLIKGPQSELWRLESAKKDFNIFSDEDLVCFSFIYQTMLDDVHISIDEFIKNEIVKPLPMLENKGKLYRFNEEFKLTGQKFTFSDFSGNDVYEIEATLPLKTFKIKEAASGKEVFKITKRLFNILTTYDFYLNGEKFGRFKKKLVFTHDKFEMHTIDGLLEMKNINDRLGSNYVVKLNGKPIGTIAERFTLSLHNIVFDNFILHVREEKYTPLIAALGAMAAREISRDRNRTS